MTASPIDLLNVENVSHRYATSADSHVSVLSDISFRLDRGDSLAVIGPSGCGKTTLLLLIAGLVPLASGRISIFGEHVSGPRRETGLVLQDYGLFPWKTVRQNVELGAKIRKATEARPRARALMEELGITELSRHYPQQISGGQRQRVALARALLLSPDLLLLDEPFAALDAMTRERLQQVLLSLFAPRSFSFIIVTHSIEEAVILGRRVLILGNRPATIAAVFDNPAFGLPDVRAQEAFFSACVKVRRLLEAAG